MIDATASLRAAEQISAATLIDYLRASGWSSRPSRVEGIAIFSKHISGADNPVQFILPVEPAVAEERWRVADALRTIAKIEGSSEARIAEKVQQTTSEGMPVFKGEKSIASDKVETKNAGTSGKKKASVFLLSGSRAGLRTNKDIENFARLARKTFGLSDQSAFNILEVLENKMPIAINDFRLEVDTTKGAQEIYSTKVPPRIFAKESIYRLARQGETRARFLFAHEIGHLLLHSPASFRTSGSLKLNKTIEAQASKFALFFLIPDSIARQFKSAESLSLHCQVRREVAELRMEYLVANKKEERANVERRIEELFTRTVRDVKRHKASAGR